MGQMIHKPDANPIVLLLCNGFVGGGLGYFLMGQKKKAYIAWGVFCVCLFVLTPCTVGACAPVAFFVNWLFAYDAYVLGQKLQNGQSIGENENGLEFLNAIFKD